MFSNSKNLFNYEYDNKGNCIKIKVVERGDNEYEVAYIYDENNKEVKCISSRYKRHDTIQSKYNEAGQCIEQGVYRKYGYKEVKTYTTNGLLEKEASYQDADIINRTMDKPWQVVLYSYNTKQQLIKKEVQDFEKGVWVLTYSYYSNGLPKEEIEHKDNTIIHTLKTVYEYWDR